MSEGTRERWNKPALALLAAYWVFLALCTHLRHPPRVIMRLGLADKWLHMLAFAVLTWLIALNWSLRTRLGWRQYLMILGIVATYAVIDELTQILVGRACEPLDWTADMIGASVALALFALIDRRPRG